MCIVNSVLMHLRRVSLFEDFSMSFGVIPRITKVQGGATGARTQDRRIMSP